MVKNKISISQYNEKVKDVREVKTELFVVQAELAKAEECDVMDNCQNCKGEGRVEDGYGNLNHNITGQMLYKDCPECEGKGYK